jgi:WS/DGAT/MGAT family acyltransferase
MTSHQKIPLNPFDAAWFFIETIRTPANVGPLLVFSRPANAPDSFISDIVEQWRASKTFAAPFNYLIRRAPTPHWEVLGDDEIDLDYHLRHSALPAPGGERELGVMISRLHSHPLDMNRPLWECHVIEGLEGGRFALYLKLHHGQVDGMAVTRLIEGVMTRDPSVRDLLPPWAVGVEGNKAAGDAPTPRTDAPAPRVDRSLASTVVNAVGGAGDLAGGLAHAAWDAGSAVNTFTRMTSKIVLGNGRDLTGPFQAPRAIFNGRISAQRRFATQHYDLARFKHVAKTANVTINDVFLSISGGAMRRYLSELDALPKRSIVGQVPVSLRKKDSAALGNKIGFIYARLHTEISDPVERLNAVHASTQAAKSVQESLPDGAVTPFTFLLTGPYMAQIMLGMGGYVPPAANLVISNVAGPRQTLYYNGAKVENFYGPSVLFHGQALNITMSSYDSTANVSFTACRDSMPHMQRLALYTGDALAELEAALGISAAVGVQG